MKYGSLFSGAGLGDFGFEMAGLEVAWQCEVNEYARKILNLRWPDVKKYEEIKAIKPEELEPVDLITGGFPCQPFSVAGKQLGENDDRNLWPEMFRIIKAVKPRWVVAENVPGIIPLYLDTVLSDLGSQGYTCWPIVFSSHSLGAWHKRERLWIICYTEHYGQLATQERRSTQEGNDGNKARSEQASEPTGPSEQYAPLADTRCEHGQRNSSELETSKTKWNPSFLSPEPSSSGFRGYWQSEPSVGRVANGIANRVDRLKCLGNGQTPCSTYVIGKWIMEIDNTPQPNEG